MDQTTLALLVRLAIEIPIVVSLIFLVLKLEAMRQTAMKDREIFYQKIFDGLIELVGELASKNNPDSMLSRQLRNFEEHIEAQRKKP